MERNLCSGDPVAGPEPDVGADVDWTLAGAPAEACGSRRQPSALDFLDSHSGQFLVHKFFSTVLEDCCPLFRFVDDIPVDWEAIGEALGKDPGDCMLQMQYILDLVFGRAEFSREDRELLLRLHRGGFWAPGEQRGGGAPGADLVAGHLQRSYFRGYSLLTTAREVRLALLVLQGAREGETEAGREPG